MAAILFTGRWVNIFCIVFTINSVRQEPRGYSPSIDAVSHSFIVFLMCLYSPGRHLPRAFWYHLVYLIRRSREIPKPRDGMRQWRHPPKFHKGFGNTATEARVKYQGELIFWTHTSRFREFARWGRRASCSLVKQFPAHAHISDSIFYVKRALICFSEWLWHTNKCLATITYRFVGKKNNMIA